MLRLLSEAITHVLRACLLAVARCLLRLCTVCLGGQRAARQAVFQAMLEVPWVPGEGIPDSPTDGTDYAALLEAGVCVCVCSQRPAAQHERGLGMHMHSD